MDSSRYEEIISKPYMSIGELREITGLKHTAATNLANKCRKCFGGNIPMMPRNIKTESFLKYFGTSTAEEIKRLHGA